MANKKVYRKPALAFCGKIADVVQRGGPYNKGDRRGSQSRRS